MTRAKRRYLLALVEWMVFAARWRALGSHLQSCDVCRTFHDAGQHTGNQI